MPTKSTKIDRRRFLQWMGTLGLAAAAGCAPKAGEPASTQAASTPTATRVLPTVAPTRSATFTPKPATPTAVPKAVVALGRAGSYDLKLLRAQWRTMLDGLGGLNGLIKPGAKAGIKVNLTGRPSMDSPDKPPAPEYFVTHPAVVQVLCEWLQDAGADKLYILDGIADETAWKKWGYADMAQPLGAKLIDLSKPAPYSQFGTFPVGKQARIYNAFLLNRLLGEVDVFLSVAKLKCHSVMGVTLSMKNLIGLTPLYEYMKSPSDNARTALHGSSDYDVRLPDVILDLNQARPIDLAVIDGVFTCEGGAGPWDKNLAQVKPGILAAGTDPVATDAVSTALMGFNPEAAAKALPFTRTNNYLAMAHNAGMGTNVLKEIGVVGESLEAMRHPFQPA
jgi:uncharacterized protein (DUF362 family)